MDKCAAKTDDASSAIIRTAMEETQKSHPPDSLDSLLQKERTMGENHRKLSKTRQQLQ